MPLRRVVASTLAVAVALSGAAGCATAPVPRPPPPSTAPAFDGDAAWQLVSRALPGRWRLVPAAGATHPPFEVSYRLVANGSALVENWAVNTAHETETVFYRDHARLLETHFCAQGNQPRLAAVASDADAVRFRFVDVTNRADDQDMLVARTLRVAPAELEITETYRTATGADEVTTYRFARASD